MGSPEQAVSKGEDGAGIPFLSALRQGVSGRCSELCLQLARANDGGPGVDEQSFADIEEGGWKEWRDGLRKEFHDKTYKPQPVRRKMISNAGGGERPLGIPTWTS